MTRWIRLEGYRPVHLVDVFPVNGSGPWITRCGQVVPTTEAVEITAPTKLSRCRQCERFRLADAEAL